MNASVVKAVAGFVKAVKEPEKTSKVFFYIIIGIAVLILLMGSMFTRLLSCFSGNVMSKDMDVTKTEIYYFCEDVYGVYLDWLKEEMDKSERQFKKEKTYTVEIPITEIVDGVEVVRYKYEEKFNWSIEKQINNVSYAYIMAYISANYDIKDKDIRKHVNSGEILKYLQEISPLCSRRNDGISRIVFYNDLIGTHSIVERYFNDDSKKAELFLQSFDLYVDYLGYNGILVNQIPGMSYDITPFLHDTGMEIPHYYQNDFITYPYGKGSIASSGCAPTCLAMVCSYLKECEISPVNIVSQIGNKYYVTNQGSSWDIFPGVAQIYEVECINLGLSSEEVLKELQAGHPVIASMGKGTFTSQGHFIVLRGIEDSNFLINDPNRSNCYKYDTDRFDIELVLREAKNFWSFY